jgi:hypothetical protein
MAVIIVDVPSDHDQTRLLDINCAFVILHAIIAFVLDALHISRELGV